MEDRASLLFLPSTVRDSQCGRLSSRETERGHSYLLRIVIHFMWQQNQNAPSSARRLASTASPGSLSRRAIIALRLACRDVSKSISEVAAGLGFPDRFKICAEIIVVLMSL
jgi:hypothetical protein